MSWMMSCRTAWNHSGLFSNFSLLCKKHGSQPALRSWHHPLSHLVFERRGIWILQVANTPIEILNRLDNFVQIGWRFHMLIDYLELNAVLNSMQIFLAVCIYRNPYSFECSLCSGCNENHTETVPFAAYVSTALSAALGPQMAWPASSSHPGHLHAACSAAI